MCRVRGALEQLLALRVDADLQALFLDRAHVLTMAVHGSGIKALRRPQPLRQLPGDAPPPQHGLRDAKFSPSRNRCRLRFRPESLPVGRRRSEELVAQSCLLFLPHCEVECDCKTTRCNALVCLGVVHATMDSAITSGIVGAVVGAVFTAGGTWAVSVRLDRQRDSRRLIAAIGVVAAEIEENANRLSRRNAQLEDLTLGDWTQKQGRACSARIAQRPALDPCRRALRRDIRGTTEARAFASGFRSERHAEEAARRVRVA